MNKYMDKQDTNKDTNNENVCCMTDSSSQEEQRWLYECEQAFLRLKFEELSGKEEWEKFSRRIREEERKRKQMQRNLRLALTTVAAAAVAMIAVFILGNNTGESKNTPPMQVIVESETKQLPFIETEPVQSSPAAPATPTKIALSHPIQAEGVVLSPTEADYTNAHTSQIRRNIVSIPRGQVYKITLSDGTEVWMNTSSRLSFPTRFSGSNRTVRLEGEAYFKVAHDAEHPFLIVTDKLTTEVLGTEFNVKAYQDSEAHVTLVRGSVRVSMPETEQEVTLQPGDDITCTGDSYSVQQVDITYYVQWMEGYFYYDNVCLADILKDLGRWYNVTISMEQDSLLLAQRLHFIADRSESIDNVVENLNAYQYLSVEKEDSKIIVKRRK